MVWILCLGFAIFAQAGTVWRFYVETQIVQPSFASLGLELYAQPGFWLVVPQSDAARQAGVPGDPSKYKYLGGINGRRLGGGEGAEEIARLLQGPDGEQVTLTLADLRGGHLIRSSEIPVRLTRSAENRAPVYRMSGRSGKIITHFIDLAVTVFILLAAFILRRRRFHEPIAILISFALLFMATVGTLTIWEWLSLPPLVGLYVPDLIWLALLLIAAPAFPSGRYAPAWTRWFTVAVPVGMAVFALLLLFWPALAKARGWLMLAAIAGLLLAGLLCVIFRLRSMPEGAERQRMNWAILGLAIGLILYAPTKLVEMQMGFVSQQIPDSIEGTARIAAYILNRLSYIIMTLALVAPLLDYRLNNAEAAVGRSVGYAVATTVVCVVWAGSTAAVDALIKGFAQNRYPGLATGISTLVALAVFAPTKTRALAWAETSFQRALMRLRSVPERIARWQLGDEPGAVAKSALKAITDGVDGTGAALISRPDGEGPEVVGVHQISEEEAMALLGDGGPGTGQADAFMLRIETTDYTGRSFTLLVGPRGDGAAYSKRERAAVSAIAETLADAIHAASRRAALNARLSGALAEISERLDQTPGKPSPGGETPSAGLSPSR